MTVTAELPDRTDRKSQPKALIADPESPRGRLLLAASRLFAEKGFAGTTVRDIAAEVGILSGSIFHHFKSKEEILCEVMCAVIEKALVGFDEELVVAKSLEDELHTLIRLELLAVHDRSGAGFGILGSEWRHLGQESQQKVLSRRDRYNDMWIARLERARAEGLHDTDPALLRNFLRGAIVDSAIWFRSDGRLSFEDLESELYRMLFSGRPTVA